MSNYGASAVVMDTGHVSIILPNTQAAVFVTRLCGSIMKCGRFYDAAACIYDRMYAILEAGSGCDKAELLLMTREIHVVFEDLSSDFTETLTAEDTIKGYYVNGGYQFVMTKTIAYVIYTIVCSTPDVAADRYNVIYDLRDYLKAIFPLPPVKLEVISCTISN